MSDGKKLIAAILESGSVVTLRLASEDLFEDDELVPFQFIRSHYRRYGELPDIRTVEQETNSRFPPSPESVDYYLKRVYDRRLFVALRTEFAELRGALQNFNVDSAKEIIDRMKSACRVGTPDNDVRDVREASTAVLAEYAEAHLNPGMSGVPTGWPLLDEAIGGYQKGDLVAWVARMGVGKCMAPHTPVLKANGDTVRIDSLQVGDQLMGPDSRPRNVLSTTTGREEMFKVTPQHGEEWECNRSHILSLVCANTIDKVHVQGTHHLYSVDEFLSLPSRVQTNLRLWRAAIDFAPQPTILDPYIVGLWLGDGTFGYPRFSTIDPEVVEYLQQQADTAGYRLTQYEKRGGFCPQYGIVKDNKADNYFTIFFDRYCVAGSEKRIPKSYLRNTREVRLGVLAGLIDSDGHLAASGHYEFCTKYEGLRDDMLYLVRSLGFGVTYAAKVVNGSTYWRINIRPTETVPVLLPRKRAALTERRSRADWSSFQLTSLGEGAYFGITLDRDSLYVLGDFTVTHNTYLILKQALHAWSNGYSVLIVTMEMTITQIVRRAIGMEVGINPDFIKKGTLDEFGMRRIRGYVSQIAHADRLNIFAGSFSKKVSDIEILIHELSPDIIFIDGAYLLRPDTVSKGASRLERVAEVYDELKKLTITSDRPIITTSQFSRQAGKRGKDGSLETISFSDAIAMHSSVVFSIKEGAPPNEHSRRELEILKGREGESGTYHVNYRFMPMDFTEVLESQQTAESTSLDWMG